MAATSVTKTKPKSKHGARPAAQSVQPVTPRLDLWMTVFLSIFGISMFASGIHTLTAGAESSANLLGIIGALSGGIVIGITVAKLAARRGSK